MDFPEINGNESLKKSLGDLMEHNRMPHAVVINGGTPAQRDALVNKITMWAICSADNKPCGVCKNCVNAKGRTHSDIYYAQGSGKTGIYNKDELSKIISDTSIKPNDADRKVYVFNDCDGKLPVISQNVFLKTLEEPPQDVLFLLTCEDSRSLLETIRSRCSVFTLENSSQPDEESLDLAKEIVLGIVSLSEMNLLKATYKLNDRQKSLETLDLIALLLRDGLAVCCGGEAEMDEQIAQTLCKKLTKAHYLKLIDITKDAKVKINQNVGLKLVGTWLCAEYRRTLWQR